MIDGKKNRKDFASIVYETYKDFAENTSIHGLKYTVKSSVAVYEKVFWSVVVLAGLCGAGYMTVLFWNRYTSNPTRTSILTAYAPNTAVPFPAVTLCNINRLMEDQMEEFLDTLTMKEDEAEAVKRAFPHLLAFAHDLYTKTYNMTELTILHNVLIKNNYNNVSVVMKKLTQPCEDMLMKCMWQFKTVPCREIFEDTLTTDGYCCSFNYIREYRNGSRRSLHTPFNGFNSGLVLFVDPEIQKIQYSSLHSSGLKVFIHSPGDYPGSGSVYKIVSAGRQTYLQISASKMICSNDIKRLTIAQRQCVYSDEVPLKDFHLYSDTNCLTQCEEEYLYAKCGCVPFYYPFSKRRVCNITSIPCLDGSIGNTMSNITNACNCPAQCEDIFYSVLSSSVVFGTEEARPTSSFLEDQEIKDDSMVLFIYFAGDRQTILYKDIITSTIYLLSSFGGVYSLFLGCSFITIVEILYYCTFRLMVNLKLVGRIDKTGPKTKKDETKHHEKLWPYEGSIFVN